MLCERLLYCSHTKDKKNVHICSGQMQPFPNAGIFRSNLRKQLEPLESWVSVRPGRTSDSSRSLSYSDLCGLVAQAEQIL